MYDSDGHRVISALVRLIDKYTELYMRVVFILSAFAWMTFMALIGFLPNAIVNQWLPLNDKFLHLSCFLVLTILIYLIWELPW